MKYTFTWDNLFAVLKVLAWSASAAVATTLLMVWQQTEVPAEYAVLVPIVNTILYAVKEFFSEER